MGVRITPFKLLCLCAILFTLLSSAVTANKEDADLVFDNLEETNSNSARINRDTLNKNNLNVQSSQDDHWIYEKLHRFKRGLFDFWLPTTTPAPEEEEVTESSAELQEVDQHQQQTAYFDGPSSENIKVNSDYDEITKENLHSYNPNNREDDEDDNLEPSGDFSGTNGEEESNHPAFYRITFTLMEPFRDAFNNKQSSEYKEIAEDIQENVDSLYTELPGQQDSQVVKIQRRPSDSFTSLVTVDLHSIGFYNKEKLKDFIYDQIRDYHSIGSLKVNNQDFHFKDFDAIDKTRTCNSEEIQCKNGECVPGNSRCNGYDDCEDGSDELGCSTTDVPIPDPETEIEPEENEPDNDIYPDGDGGSTETTSSNEASPSGSRCRGDDVISCADGSTICADQECDGNKDCPDGSDESSCPENEITECAEGEMACDISRCIPKSSVCDGVANCVDNTDEQGCEAAGCQQGQFRCDSGHCLDMSQRCNGHEECPNGEDEYGCPPPREGECEAHERRCDDGTCIEQIYFCNNKYDCPDKSDEKNCCLLDQFRCSNGTCLTLNKKCDGVADCEHSEDEDNCAFCNKNEFRCHDGGCVMISKQCDGTKDCSDGSDEENCSVSGEECLAGEFDCGSNNCIPSSSRCDGRRDCPNGIDEIDCPSQIIPCERNQFTCNNGQCIASHYKCDGTQDCADNSDEADCGCNSNEFLCNDGSCIPNYNRCDGSSNCRDGSDEYNCPTAPPISPPERQCPPGSSPCRSYNECFTNSERCNGYNECSDGTDELDCPSTVNCRYGEELCRNKQQCYPISGHCDGRADCQDGSDEDSCQIDKACSSGEFRCENGPCISRSLRCNGKVDCPLDSSDELDCSEISGTYYQTSNLLNLKTYPTAQEIKESIYNLGREVVFRCRDEGSTRARVQWTRENGRMPHGYRDINGRLELPEIKVEDAGTYICSAVGYSPSTPGAQVKVQLEVNRYLPPTARPPQACGLYEATCSNGDCIPKNQVCDGHYDCKDGSDELRCSPHGCEPNEFRCANKKCILKTWRCDSDDDCGDNSDEMNCATNPPGYPCEFQQFACRSGNQCIPRSFHCDMSNDCADGSDEIGCSPVTILKPPPPMVQVKRGETLIIVCTAVGVPTPEISWRLNWGHIPEKCKTTSVDGVGTLECPDMQEHDQGAYSCEGINIKGAVIATPDAIVVVTPDDSVCPRGFFNDQARNPNECISCFCFGVTNECSSADLFTYHFQPPFDSHKIMGVNINPNSGIVDIRDDTIYRDGETRLTPLINGLHAKVESPSSYVLQSNTVPYFAMPENFHGNQLKSYGGYLKYNVRYYGHGATTNSAPDVILSGNGYNLLHVGQPIQAGRNETVNVRLFVGSWIKRSETGPESIATREEIMMALAKVSNILIKMQYVHGHLDTTIDQIEMDSAAIQNLGLGQASYVEECRCPVGYSGLSCESCASGYSRHTSGPWLGKCYKEEEICEPGYYGDPSRGIPCKICPCPLTNPGNQFARTCRLDYDGDVTCDCPPSHVGRRCEYCATGFTGNPLLPGDSCKPSECDQRGSISGNTIGECRCKPNTDGPSCNVCQKNTFHLSAMNQFGCISCFCMGVTDQCTSSNWYRDKVTSVFTTSKNDFKLVESNDKNTQIEDGIVLDSNNREIVYSNFRRPDVYYWSLPSRFLGDKVTSYGGYLVYSLRYVPAPGGQSSKNNAPDVELISDNRIILTYFNNEQQPLPNTVQTFRVPLLEQYWQRTDGQPFDRENFLMALADVNAFLIKATYTTNTREVALKNVSLDIADSRNTGLERAYAVEQCNCPKGYTGLSCEDCDAGYTRTSDDIYLGRCEKCQCNGHSNKCHPDTGDCQECRDHTTGPSCERCEPGYEEVPGDRVSCRYVGGPSQTCDCNSVGSISNDCIGGQCQCKTNVEGNTCDRCREGTFGLSPYIAEGCQSCFCSGIATECSESNLYIEQIPSQLFDQDRHGFILTDQNMRDKITNNFNINVAMNEISYVFRPSHDGSYFWSLPNTFTGHKIKSYGGKLEFTQKYTQRPGGDYLVDRDIIIMGNGITIYWTNPIKQQPNIVNKVSVILSPVTKWHRYDQRQGPKPASREDILKVLANVNAILIRAQLSTDTASSFISDLTLDTAVDQYTGQSRANNVEVCICPQGYSGTSCELCSTGYYRDINDIGTGPLGSCSKCPCNGNEVGCNVGPDNRVFCNCLPGYAGRNCEHIESEVTTPIPDPGPIPNKPTIVVTITSPKLTIKEVGGEVRFKCSAQSLLNKDLRIQWRKQDGVLPERAIDDYYGLLVITDLKVSDSGNYVCQAYDGLTIVTDHVNLAVGGNNEVAPISKVSPDYLEVNEGEPIEIVCSASGNPTPTFRWSRTQRTEFSPSFRMTDNVLRIHSARVSDEGEYECTASNSAGEHTSRTTIYVKEIPAGPSTRPIITPPHFTGTSGQSFTLNCAAGTGVRYINWSKQDGHLPYNSRDENGILIVTNTNPQDSGVYICTVTNYQGAVTTATANVYISETNTGTYPTAEVVPSRQDVDQGTTVEIHCSATGNPTPTVKWTKLGSALPSNVQTTGPVLRIHNTQVSDRGVYVCVASNNLGLAQVSSILEVQAREHPVIEIYPEHSQSINVGRSAIMQCRITAGLPLPTIKWHRPNGKQIGARVEQLSNGVLRFNDIQEEDGGEYICTAHNVVGEVTALANILIRTPPMIRITPNVETLTVQEGQRVNLECRAEGIPKPTVQWQTQQIRPPSYSQDNLLRGASLHVAMYYISSATANDQGIYTCTASSSAGIDEKTIRLVVENENSIPRRGGDITGEDPGAGGNDNRWYPRGKTLDRQNFVVPVGNRADLRCNMQQTGKEQIYINWIRADNSSLPQYSERKDDTLVVYNAQPSDAGEYQCLGINSATGDILFIVSVTLKVLSSPRITLNPTSQVVRPGEDAMIECSATGEQPITITWSGLNRTMPSSVYTKDGIIRFHGIQVSDAGRYKCTAINSVGEADSAAEVLVEEEEQPQVVAENKQQTVESGQTVTLSCSVQREYEHEVQWSRDYQSVPTNSRVEANRLMIYNVQPSNAGKYYCSVSNNRGQSSDYIELVVNDQNSRPSTPTLDIVGKPQDPRVGENLDIYCRSTEPGVIATWTKQSGRIADNVHISGGSLRIESLRLENAGIYRCEARGYEGFYHKDYLVDIIDSYDDKKIAIETVPRGSTIILKCRTDLEEPVSYVWTKQQGSLPRDVDVYANQIQLNEVDGNDAGTYVCTSRNPYRSIEAPTILLITGIVPYFIQAPQSYISMLPLKESYSEFNIEITIKPENHNGLILYNGDEGSAANGDFISLSLVGAIPEFRFNLGHNISTTLISGDRPLTLGEWHTIKISRNRRRGSMYVDGEGPFTGTAVGKFFGLRLREPMYIGGVPNFRDISPLANAAVGIVGCVSKLKIGHEYLDIMKEAKMKQGVTNCETCSQQPCQNRGVCQESLNKDGFMCICPVGYSGPTCNKVGGESCSAYTCGTGRCLDTEDSYECLCPMGKIGRNCEQEIEIIEPAFSKNAYVAYPKLQQQRRLKITMKIKPKDLSDGIIAYCAENEEGHGDFISLAIKDKHLEFKFDVGNGPVLIRSPNELKPDVWEAITASRMQNEGRLFINGDPPLFSRSPGNHRALNLNTQFFLGGVNTERIKINSGVNVNTGFNGCISQVSISNNNLKLVEYAEDSANVVDCSSLNQEMNNHVNEEDNELFTCNDFPCQNNGECHMQYGRYSCSCRDGFTGANCEIPPLRICEQQRPCQNFGTCRQENDQYYCDCPKGYTGTNCEITATIRNDVNFNGNGYLEFNRNLLNHEDDDLNEVIALELSTNSTNGLIFWHGQRPNEDGRGQDYISLAVVDGYLVFSFDLGSGPAVITNKKVNVSDNSRHRVILKRRGSDGSIEIDNDYIVEGQAEGFTNQMNCNGNIYLGGTPDIDLMTGNRFESGFKGCIHGFELQDSRSIDLGITAISGANVKACYRSENDIDDYDRDEFVN